MLQLLQLNSGTRPENRAAVREKYARIPSKFICDKVKSITLQIPSDAKV